MMKKLLVFAMVLGMASMAMAIPYFQVDPAYQKSDYHPSDVIQIDLVSPSNDLPVTGVAIDAISDGALGGLGESPLTANANFNTITSMGTLNADGWIVEGVYLNDTTIPARGATGILYTFDYHVPSVPPSTLIPIQSINDGVYWFSEIDYKGGSSYLNPILLSGTIHVIPEPATIALLGLGGLLLRRRK
jgi:hypothetical protein